MRRANGTGCVRKLSGKRRKPYQALITLRFENGKQIYKSLGTYISRPEAENELYKYIIAKQEECSKATLKNLYEEWSEIKFNKISDSTIKTYRQTFSKISDLHDYDIKDLKTSILQKKCDELSEVYKNFFKTMMSMIFNYAIQNDITDKNYAIYIECKKYKAVKEKRCFTISEIELIENCKKDKERIIKILLYTGMRVSELLDMKNEDFFKKENMLCIRSGKTYSSKRIIPIHKNIIDDIYYFHNKNNKYLITLNENKHVSYQTLIKYVSKEYNHTLHETRHTFATQCNRLKLNHYATKKMLGHAVNDITLNVYTHNDDELLRELINNFKY